MNLWYAIHTKPRQDDVAQINLVRQGLEVYRPRIGVRRQRRGQWVEVVESLFPRYLFLHINPAVDSVGTIRSTRGVSGLVRFGNQLLSVPDEVIEQIKKREDPVTGLHRLGAEVFERGDRVKATCGILMDLEGVFLAEKGEDRVVILMHLLNRDTPVTLPRREIRPVIT
jgi:transcriptional antiterminator RfaH